MKKRLLIGLAGLLVLAGVVVWLEPTGVVLGWLHGEAFYRNRPTRYWDKALTDTDPKRQVDTRQQLKDGGGAAVPVLAQLLQSGKVEARWRAADLLGQMGADARDAAPALVQALSDADPHVCAVAATALAAIGPAGPEAVPPLRDLLGSDNAVPALRALARYGDKAAAVVPRAIELLRDEDSEVRWNAARTLGKIGPAAKEAVPALTAAMHDREALVREHAAEALGDIGAAAKDAVPDLIVALKDPDPRVRRDVVRSLGQIGPEARSAGEAIRPLLKDKDAKVRKAAIIALEQIEKPAAGESR